MSKALRIKIISYLREQNAVAKYVDIRDHVLSGNDSVAQRNELKATLDYLSNKRLIAINGSYEFLHWTASYGLYNLDNKKIATKLTKTGQAYHPENESDGMEATVPPVLAVIKKSGQQDNTTSQGAESEVLTMPDTQPAPVAAEPEPLPWYVASAEPEAQKPVEPEPLPWYTAPVEPEAEKPTEPEQQLPWYVAPAEPEATKPTDAEPQLPWYTEPEPEPAKSPVTPDSELPWYVKPVHEDGDGFESEMLGDISETKAVEPGEDKKPEPNTPEQPKPAPLKGLDEYIPLQAWYNDIEPKSSVPEPVKPEPKVPEPQPPTEEPPRPLPWENETEEQKEPVIYRFPPLEFKPENTVKQPQPMVIEKLNENLSHSIDALSNIKIKRPSMLTGDFEKDGNIIMKFVLVVVLFLLFGCIVWLYMG